MSASLHSGNKPLMIILPAKYLPVGTFLCNFQINMHLVAIPNRKNQFHTEKGYEVSFKIEPTIAVNIILQRSH